MFAQSMTNKNKCVHAPMNGNGGSAATMVRDNVRMNPPKFLDERLMRILKVSWMRSRISLR